jgi:glyoxylase I family protein
MFQTTVVDHLVFRVPNMTRTERFYNVLLGEPFKADGYIMYMVGDTRLFFTPYFEHATPFNKENIGLNHMALAVGTSEDLETIELHLSRHAIAHSEIKLWQDGLTKYIWLDDPDGIRIEYWLRLPQVPSL